MDNNLKKNVWKHGWQLKKKVCLETWIAVFKKRFVWKHRLQFKKQVCLET